MFNARGILEVTLITFPAVTVKFLVSKSGNVGLALFYQKFLGPRQNLRPCSIRAVKASKIANDDVISRKTVL